MPYRDVALARESSRRSSQRLRAVARIERAQAEELRLAARPPKPVADLAWAAGVFEGEGTLTISRSSLGNTRPYVSLTSTDLEIVAFFQERWPGSLYSRRPSPRAREATTWTLNSGFPIKAFLLDLSDYWRTTRSKERAALLLADVSERVQGSRDPDYRYRSRLRLEQMRILNKRGSAA